MDSKTGHFDTDSPAVVVISDADTSKVPRDGRLYRQQRWPLGYCAPLSFRQPPARLLAIIARNISTSASSSMASPS